MKKKKQKKDPIFNNIADLIQAVTLTILFICAILMIGTAVLKLINYGT